MSIISGGRSYRFSPKMSMAKEHHDVKNRANPTWANDMALNQRGKIIVPYKDTLKPQRPGQRSNGWESNYGKYSNQTYGHTPR